MICVLENVSTSHDPKFPIEFHIINMAHPSGNCFVHTCDKKHFITFYIKCNSFPWSFRYVVCTPTRWTLSRLLKWGLYAAEDGWDSSVCIATEYRLDACGTRVWSPAGARDFCLHHSVQTSSGAHPISCLGCTEGSFPSGKAAGAWSWPLTSI
jgi:hypothetical protein